MSQALVLPLAQTPGLMPPGSSRSCAELRSSPHRTFLWPSTSHQLTVIYRGGEEMLQRKEPFPEMGKTAGPRRSVSHDNGMFLVLKGTETTGAPPVNESNSLNQSDIRK